ncbi:hypothetical protein L1987_32614 [Smallanthus sonchifolius]|uniref:Uncharacterized protein n=1 Tax=Smallanthus sonchifolius TaxID=185202 RepID=A0ACB9HPX7_9ASTR|nr:hypothetical protein L1987_32614 [Smallanthus sonchifolius]
MLSETSHIGDCSWTFQHTNRSSSSINASEVVKAMMIGRELSHREMWKQSHCKIGSRPLDKDLSCSSSLVENIDLEDVDLEGNIQEENLNWVDNRAPETLAKYEGYLMKKYGKERNK